MSDANAADQALGDALVRAAHAAGFRRCALHGLKRLSGGASKESWAFDLVDEAGASIPMVLRRQPADLRFSFSGMDSLATEARLLQQAAAAGVPVPEVHFVLPHGADAGDGYAMARIAGETVGTRILKDPALESARAELARQCGAALARIHAVPIEGLPALAAFSPHEELDALRTRYFATGQDRPVFDFALSWLADHMPLDGRRTLVHGDFRNGNIIVDEEGLRAVLDWELAHIGAPASDLAWLCVTSWRFQRPDLPVGGFGTREQLLEGYRAAGGGAIDADELFAWEVFQTLNWGIMCAEVGATFMGGTRSVEGAMIARRASETEFDLLRLLLPEHGGWNA